MFDAKLTPRQIKQRYSWQAIKKIDVNSKKLDHEEIKEYIRIYDGHFAKIINKIKYTLIYFNNEQDMMKAIHEIGAGLLLKSQDELIDKDGKFRARGTRQKSKQERMNNFSKRRIVCQLPRVRTGLMLMILIIEY